MTIVFGPNLQVPYRVLSIASRVACPSIYLCLIIKRFRSRSERADFCNDNGEPMAVSLRSLVTLFISVFLSVVRVCLPRSPLLAVLWSSWLCFFFLLECVCLPSLYSPWVPSLAVLRFSWAMS